MQLVILMGRVVLQLTSHLGKKMDRGKKPSLAVTNQNHQIYMDLKDIIREQALKYLPAKSLRRCTGVCREWRLYIASPFFAHNQSNSFHGLSGFFSQSNSSDPSFVSIDPRAYGIPDPSLNFLPEKVDIKSSSNGLVCCQGRTGNRPYYICNPVTRQWKKLPKSEADHGSNPALVLVFKPSVLNFVAEFKLVCAFASDLDGYEFDIYSSSDNSWKQSREILFGNRCIIPTSGVHVDGVIYWQSRTRGIIAFDMAKERSTILYAYMGDYFGEFNGKLCAARITARSLHIDELINAHSNTMETLSRVQAWKKRQISLSNPLFEGRTDVGKLVLLGENVAVIRFGSTLVSYNLNTNEVIQLSSAAGEFTNIVPYVNSLVEI